MEKQCLEVRAASNQADFERERERCDTLVIEALKLAKLAISAREKAARLDGELSAVWGSSPLVEMVCFPNLPP